ncbi:hypothetical protein FIBSPDRAFT_750832 [Athelia psychrophila]|uniref:DUF6830 domain-containing protein n=1 Tax=Athelia psychrophila TaxID=1759441 RepID=A0A166DXR2_9AGAM|nr:hypothetical protein FIBSPDRAFT_750832 [Fibularhizoctonia sp. CBS 109695]
MGLSHFPFSSLRDWDLGHFLANSSLSQAEIDKFLKLDRIKKDPASFTSAAGLRKLIEGLPPVPEWKFVEIKIPGYSTKEPMILYWRDGLEVLEHLFANPIFASSMETTPYRLLDENQRPVGHTLLGVIAASDKTPLTVGTGSKEMWPFLLSIANILAGVRMKATSHAFAIAGYLPIPKFRDVSPPLQAALSARVFHAAVSIITKSMQEAEKVGHTMPDPDGHLRICHPVLASYIADLPEQRLIACVTQNQSPTSLATQAEFGDFEQRPPRTHDYTLGLIYQALARASPSDLAAYIREAAALGLNGVHQPFWRNWHGADPSKFLTPDALHAWHKFFFDHVIRWAINMIGGDELDRRLSSLQRCVGVRHWPSGVSKLKQCTGREHRDLEKVIVAVIAGAVHPQVLKSIRALLEFIFHAQGQLLYEEQLHSIRESLREFHHYKNSILLSGGRLGKHGSMTHFNLPKLEGMGRVAWNASLMGAPYQWSSDITERCHITLVKQPFRSTNKRADFPAQCARYMDRLEKCRQFQLYTSLTYHRRSLLNVMVEEATDIADHYPEATWLSHALPAGEYSVRGAAAKRSLFDKVRNQVSDDHEVAFSVTIQPHFPKNSIADAAQLFVLPDFHPSLGDYFVLAQSHSERNGRRKSSSDCELPFTHLNVWRSFRMQQHSTQDPRILLPPRTVQALPPATDMPYGRCNTVLIRDSAGEGLADSSVVQIRIIFQPMRAPAAADPSAIYFYGESFVFSSANKDVNEAGQEVFVPEVGIDMFVVNRHLRNDGTRVGDIFKLVDICEFVELVPKYGRTMPAHINSDNSLELMHSYYINHFASKETYHAILSYQ